MRSSFTIGGFRNRHGRVLRAVAVFFLLYTGADIALPQYFCGGEASGLPDVIIASTSVAVGGETRVHTNSYLTASDASGSQGERPEAETPHEEDCFCCCAHVLTGLAFKVVESAELKSPQTSYEERFILSPPLPLQYHPPRFA